MVIFIPPNRNLAGEGNPVDVRIVYETTGNYLKIEDTVANTDIIFSLNILKYNTIRNNGNEETKFDISMIVENGVDSNNPEKYGMFADAALASELSILIKIKDSPIFLTSQADANEGNSITFITPRANTASLSIDLYVIAINKHNITDTFNYEVNFK
ncbi:MAG: hypothetical protein MJ185_03065 [Treponema sp.]|nr:hypothetical protein [Treponema sp.]